MIMETTKIVKVSDLKGNYASNVLENPGVYCWWFPEREIVKLFDSANYSLNIQRIQFREFNGEYYMALYCGESRNLRNRFKNHINGPQDKSTLRRTIGKLFNKTETEITDLLSECYLEWFYVDSVCMSKYIEACELAFPRYYYPFNKTDHIFNPQSQSSCEKGFETIYHDDFCDF